MNLVARTYEVPAHNLGLFIATLVNAKLALPEGFKESLPEIRTTQSIYFAHWDDNTLTWDTRPLDMAEVLAPTFYAVRWHPGVIVTRLPERTDFRQPLDGIETVNRKEGSV